MKNLGGHDSAELTFGRAVTNFAKKKGEKAMSVPYHAPQVAIWFSTAYSDSVHPHLMRVNRR